MAECQSTLEPIPSLQADIQMISADFGLPGEKKQYYIAILPTGEHLRLTKRAYDIVAYLQTPPEGASYDKMARDLAQQWHVSVDAQLLRNTIASRLAPYGLLAGIPSTMPDRRSLLTMRIPLLPKSVVSALTRRLTWLYHPILAIPVGFGAVVLFVLVSGNLLLGSKVSSFGDAAWGYVFGLLCVLWHELGHATACRRFKAPTGGIGFGFYIIYPAFYTDVTSAWRLPRKQRAIVDLGGVYFQSIALLILYVLYALTGWQAYLLAVVLNTGMILFSLNPFLRFDGYWMLNDLLGLIALDRFQGAISLAFIAGLKQGLLHPRRTYRMLADNLARLIPQNLSLWLKIFMGLYVLGATIFWFWFLIALGQWAWRLLPSYPLQVEQCIMVLHQRQWTAALLFLPSLIIPWFILTSLISVLLRLGQSGYRLLLLSEVPGSGDRRTW